MRVKSERSHSPTLAHWLSDSIVTHASVKPHVSVNCWRQTRGRKCYSLCEPWLSYLYS